MDEQNLDQQNYEQQPTEQPEEYQQEVVIEEAPAQPESEELPLEVSAIEPEKSPIAFNWKKPIIIIVVVGIIALALMLVLGG